MVSSSPDSELSLPWLHESMFMSGALHNTKFNNILAFKDDVSVQSVSYESNVTGTGTDTRVPSENSFFSHSEASQWPTVNNGGGADGVTEACSLLENLWKDILTGYGSLEQERPPSPFCQFEGNKLDSFLSCAEAGYFPKAIEERHNQLVRPTAPKSLCRVKLFIGPVPTKLREDELHKIFSKFGTVCEVLLFTKSAQKKCCGFVEMESVTAADSAINWLNGKRFFEDEPEPLLVEYAFGEATRLGLTEEDLNPLTVEVLVSVCGLPPYVTQTEVVAVLSQYGFVTNANVSKGFGLVKFLFKEEAICAVQNLNGRFVFSGWPHQLQLRMSVRNIRPKSPPASSSRSLWRKESNQSISINPRNTIGEALGMRDSFANPKDDDCKETLGSIGNASASTNDGTNDTVPGITRAGPPGANVFVFHIPNEWSEWHLVENFSPFGKLISTQIPIDKLTNRTKGYGFVSFEDVSSALRAVSAMNGYSVLNKRLKVTIKKGEEVFAINYAKQYSPEDLRFLELSTDRRNYSWRPPRENDSL